ncbi:high light inducible protein [Synechococcus phage S-CRM01]|jgi:hypothetical protein|uniref:high light inducible protein n=1 Tax=Synechococcus phage S-CRM01 TaxID=1026955 RepID=UPI000209E393|nr:high light inducible protein [Synechococcus phage S-CRM01]AEC53033.1 high light inducible protein [Synechococcus phage S-CRM01]
MTVTTNDKGQQNIFAKEPQIIMSEPTAGFTRFAELLNGRLAMIGFVAALGAYATTGQILPGIF